MLAELEFVEVSMGKFLETTVSLTLIRVSTGGGSMYQKAHLFVELEHEISQGALSKFTFIVKTCI